MNEYKNDEIINVRLDSLEKVQDTDAYLRGASDATELTEMTTEPHKINWKQKLSSRKLWAAIVGVVVGLAAAFGLEDSEWAQIA